MVARSSASIRGESRRAGHRLLVSLAQRRSKWCVAAHGVEGALACDVEDASGQRRNL